MLKFNGIAKHTFYLHLKETEFRFNHRQDNLYKTLLSFFRNHPLYIFGKLTLILFCVIFV
uniref:Transposase n=1 Tax=mine drainage metagenome TaxID=410659 RepID=E6QI99_9ZZZZ